jgi:CBS domain-containing protein
MICPDCKADNIPGVDVCASCGHDLQTLDLPHAENEFSEHLISDLLGDVEAKTALVIEPRMPVALAIALMQRHANNYVLVKEGERLLGILTERDVLLKAAGEKADLNAITARQLMSPDPVCLRASDSLAAALHKMSSGGFRHIPLQERDGTVSRVVSISDVFRHVSSFIHKHPASAR